LVEFFHEKLFLKTATLPAISMTAPFPVSLSVGKKKRFIIGKNNYQILIKIISYRWLAIDSPLLNNLLSNKSDRVIFFKRFETIAILVSLISHEREIHV